MIGILRCIRLLRYCTCRWIGILVRGLPFRNKLDGGKPSLIWGKKNRIRLQCRVTTPPWAPGADSGQREKNEIGGKIRTEKWLQCATLGSPGGDLNEYNFYFSRLYRPLSKWFAWFGCLLAKNIFWLWPPKRRQNKKGLSWGFPALSPVQSPEKAKWREAKLDMNPMDLETKPQVDWLRCWRERPVAASTALNVYKKRNSFVLIAIMVLYFIKWEEKRNGKGGDTFMIHID